MNDSHERKFTGAWIAGRIDDGSYGKIERIALNFHSSGPCIERADEQTIEELIPEVSFTFELSQPAEVSFDIFTLGGRKIMQIEPVHCSIGFHAIDWNGKDAFGDKLANGVYLYRLKAVGDEETVSFIGRLAKYE